MTQLTKYIATKQSRLVGQNCSHFVKSSSSLLYRILGDTPLSQTSVSMLYNHFDCVFFLFVPHCRKGSVIWELLRCPVTSPKREEDFWQTSPDNFKSPFPLATVANVTEIPDNQTCNHALYTTWRRYQRCQGAQPHGRIHAVTERYIAETWNKFWSGKFWSCNLGYCCPVKHKT